MTRFDEEPSPARRSSWWLPVRRQPAASLAATVATAVVVCVSAGILLASQLALLQVARLLAATRVALVLGPQVTRAEADAMHGRITASPLVAGAVLQTREQALTRVSAAMEAPGARANPLPDVWIVSLRPPVAGSSMRAFSSELAALERTFGALPGVDAVRADGTWLKWVDRWTATALDTLPIVQWTTFGALAAAVGCIAFLSGRSGRPPEGAAVRPEDGSAATAFVSGLLVGFLALLLALATAAATWNVVGGADSEWMSVGEAVSRAAIPSMAGLVIVVLMTSSVGAFLGRRA